jgi:murein DD-endopeptidase MepM/ murein hydrolase activator NlpD
VASPLPGLPVTTPYGVLGPWMAGYHTGDDYSTEGVTYLPVFATHPGTVISVTGTWGSSYGLHLIIEGPRRRIRQGYCHLARVIVDLGDVVHTGEQVALSGNTGKSTGPHLHYEERRSPFFYGDCRRPRFNHQGKQGPRP